MPHPHKVGGGLKRKSLNLGFTIVELLIVIIVIAILATLVITAYNGIQAKAHNTKTVSAVRQYVQAIEAYIAENGQYPYYTASGANNLCLGDQYPNNKCVFVGTGTPVGLGTATTNTVWNEKIRPYLGGQLPMPSSDPVDFTNGPYAGAYYFTDPTATSPTAVISYWLTGTDQCDSFSLSLTIIKSQSNVMCRLQFPSL